MALYDQLMSRGMPQVEAAPTATPMVQSTPNLRSQMQQQQQAQRQAQQAQRQQQTGQKINNLPEIQKYQQFTQGIGNRQLTPQEMQTIQSMQQGIRSNPRFQQLQQKAMELSKRQMPPGGIPKQMDQTQLRQALQGQVPNPEEFSTMQPYQMAQPYDIQTEQMPQQMPQFMSDIARGQPSPQIFGGPGFSGGMQPPMQPPMQPGMQNPYMQPPMPQQMPQQLSGLGGLAGLLGGGFGQNTKPMMGQPTGGFGGANTNSQPQGGFGSAASPSSGGMFGGGGGFGS